MRDPDLMAPESKSLSFVDLRLALLSGSFSVTLVPVLIQHEDFLLLEWM